MEDKLQNDYAWKIFEQSGKIKDYLNYLNFENKTPCFNRGEKVDAPENKGNSFKST